MCMYMFCMCVYATDVRSGSDKGSDVNGAAG